MIKLTNYKLFKDYQGYFACLNDRGFVYEVPCRAFLREAFKIDPNLKSYYKSKKWDSVYAFCLDLETIEFPFLRALAKIANDMVAKKRLLPLPKELYPSIRRYYTKTETAGDLMVINSYFRRVNALLQSGKRNVEDIPPFEDYFDDPNNLPDLPPDLPEDF